MSTMHGFEEVRRSRISEIGSEARLYRHVRTGAEVLSLVNDDENKCFGITFRTPPADSTGIAHILEHSVLCGSRKYPVKDPFIRLAQGSLNTFLNAMTYPDKTTYPTASQNLQDFYNLVDVYLDAVLFPRIPREVLEQEGWHFEIEGADKPLVYKGVVFNEMKGAYASPDSILYKLSQQSIFPDNIYGVDSGGDPAVIPDLTYEAFTGFHRRFYHPSNARIWFYGDDDPTERLRLIDAKIAEFERAPVTSDVGLQPRFAAPRRLEGTYAAGDDPAAAKSHAALNWMLDEVADPEMGFALSVLDQVLTGTPASPLHKALIDSGLGEQVISYVGFDYRQAAFMAGLKGIEAKDVDKVERLILDTLRDLVTRGFERSTVEAALNTTEFRLRENNTGRFPRGLGLMLRTMTMWLYDRDPFAALAFEAPLAKLKARLASGERVLEGLVQKHLLDNPHRATVLVKPDAGKAQREAEAETAKLARIRETLKPDEVEALVARTSQLKQWQETPDTAAAIASIPSLARSDLPRQNKQIPVAVERRQGVEVLTHDLGTNGILYVDLAFDLKALPAEKLPLVDLLGRALTETGTSGLDFVALSERIGRSTGGISASPWVSATRGRPESAARLVVRAKAVPDKAGELVDILRDVLLEPRLDDRERILQMVLEEKASAESSLAPVGSMVTSRRLRAQFSEDGWASEQIAGLTRLFALRALAERIEKDWPSVAADLAQMRRDLVTRAGLVANVTADAGILSAFLPRLDGLIGALPAAPERKAASWSWRGNARHEGFTMPAKVNYVAKGADLRALGFEPDGSALVVQTFLGTTWLWDKVRLQGGAYGGSCRLDHLSGVFAFGSYRDPNLVGTLDVYDRTAEHLRTVPLDVEQITRTVIGTIGGIDTHLLPDAKGLTSLYRHLTGADEASRQRTRDEILATSVADFRRFADAMDLVAREGRVVVLGSESAIGAANAERGGNWLEVTKVL